MYVENLDQLIANIENLHSCRSTDNPEELVFFKKLIGKGICFVACKVDGEIVFSPSRFAGYFNNNYEVHSQVDIEKNGGGTNNAIRKLLGTELPDFYLEDLYLEYCAKYDINPDKRQRRYWNIDIATKNDVEIFQEIKDALNINVKSETQQERIIQERLGQGEFRRNLIRYWKGCAITGISKLEFLRASHIKPWRDCDNFERLDPFNGLLLTPNYDVLFDKGYITFDNEGVIRISNSISKEERMIFGINENVSIEIDEKHEKYMQYHREIVFQG
ncbi:HNH endonuclease [Paenibacillus sp. An7]|uniref:HNH endonuclease n=1 Tax=Paenibacillus sp. An7 TaxID=2689577 RepID=UPI00135923E9|nr:HNH endonuclease signature motif containing protein [Paenibacillus sp. An7]